MFISGTTPPGVNGRTEATSLGEETGSSAANCGLLIKHQLGKDAKAGTPLRQEPRPTRTTGALRVMIPGRAAATRGQPELLTKDDKHKVADEPTIEEIPGPMVEQDIHMEAIKETAVPAHGPAATATTTQASLGTGGPTTMEEGSKPDPRTTGLWPPAAGLLKGSPYPRSQARTPTTSATPRGATSDRWKRGGG